MKKRIVFVTGTRADFGKIEPLAIAARDARHVVTFFITGMHMMERYGLTKIEVARVKGVGLHEFTNQTEGDPQDLVLSKTILGFSQFLKDHPTDLVIVHGDRIEALACSLVCATNYIRSAHIEGGEVSGTIDEVFRHCNTKLATYHFVSSEQAKHRVKVLGEPEGSIFVLGSPELDTHGLPTGLDIQTVLKHYEIPFQDYGIILFHPVTSEADSMGAQTKALFENLILSGKNFVVISPNNDPGSASIFDVLKTLPSDRFKQIPSMRFSYFSELLRNSNALIGNSSAGVREAPFLGIPSLDIGSRQTNRSTAASITSCAADDTLKISDFLKKSWGKRFEQDQSFGSGSTASRFISVLEDAGFWVSSMQKNFVDHKPEE